MPKAKNLRFLRKKAGLTQQSFADAIGVSAVTINNWETKKRAIPVPNAHRIAEYFDIDYMDFCDVDLELMEGNIVKHPLTDREMKSLLMFRDLSRDSQKKIDDAIEALHFIEHCSKEKRLP